jgi:hypothetical protein
MGRNVKFVESAATMEPLAEILKGSITHLNTGKFGAVSDGYIQLCGHLSQVHKPLLLTGQGT